MFSDCTLRIFVLEDQSEDFGIYFINPIKTAIKKSEKIFVLWTRVYDEDMFNKKQSEIITTTNSEVFSARLIQEDEILETSIDDKYPFQGFDIFILDNSIGIMAPKRGEECAAAIRDQFPDAVIVLLTKQGILSGDRNKSNLIRLSKRDAAKELPRLIEAIISRASFKPEQFGYVGLYRENKSIDDHTGMKVVKVAQKARTIEQIKHLSAYIEVFESDGTADDIKRLVSLSREHVTPVFVAMGPNGEWRAGSPIELQRSGVIEIPLNDINELISMYGELQIISQDPHMREILWELPSIAKQKSIVLILGESGTGKELFAKALHCLSPRKREQYIRVNCAAISEHLLESELFGHEKGAFTGAATRQIGKFELADKGTIFLDEIGELIESSQAKVLRVLDGNGFTRVGGRRELDPNVRIVAATNKDLKGAVDAGKFREDLYYRLLAIKIMIPPLRERREEIPLLVQYFIQKYNSEHQKQVLGITMEAMEKLKSHSWPGNVREMENIVARAVQKCTDYTIGPDLIELQVDDQRVSPKTAGHGADHEAESVTDHHRPQEGNLSSGRSMNFIQAWCDRLKEYPKQNTIKEIIKYYPGGEGALLPYPRGTGYCGYGILLSIVRQLGKWEQIGACLNGGANRGIIGSAMKELMSDIQERVNRNELILPSDLTFSQDAFEGQFLLNNTYYPRADSKDTPEALNLDILVDFILIENRDPYRVLAPKDNQLVGLEILSEHQLGNFDPRKFSDWKKRKKDRKKKG